MKKLFLIFTLVLGMTSCITFQDILSGVETAGDISGKANSAVNSIKETVKEDQIDKEK